MLLGLAAASRSNRCSYRSRTRVTTRPGRRRRPRDRTPLRGLGWCANPGGCSAPAVREITGRFVEFERNAVRALFAPDASHLEAALRSHPWVRTGRRPRAGHGDPRYLEPPRAHGHQLVGPRSYSRVHPVPVRSARSHSSERPSEQGAVRDTREPLEPSAGATAAASLGITSRAPIRPRAWVEFDAHDCESFRRCAPQAAEAIISGGSKARALPHRSSASARRGTRRQIAEQRVRMGQQRRADGVCFGSRGCAYLENVMCRSSAG